MGSGRRRRSKRAPAATAVVTKYVRAAISFPAGSTVRIETELGYRRGEGDLSALSSSANMLYALPRLGRTTPYLATGGGLKVAAADTWEMRTDARWFKSFGRTRSEHWRVSQGLSFDVRK
jgi:hypothetical protein